MNLILRQQKRGHRSSSGSRLDSGSMELGQHGADELAKALTATVEKLLEYRRRAMPSQNPHRCEIRKIVSDFVPMLLAIYPQGRRRYLYELDRSSKAGKLLSRDEARVRHILRAIESVEAEEGQASGRGSQSRSRSLDWFRRSVGVIEESR